VSSATISKEKQRQLVKRIDELFAARPDQKRSDAIAQAAGEFEVRPGRAAAAYYRAKRAEAKAPTRTSAKRAAPRKRCQGSCGKLYERGLLTQVAKGEWLCQECLSQTALDLAPGEAVVEASPGVTSPPDVFAGPTAGEGGEDDPSPSPLLTEITGPDGTRFVGAALTDPSLVNPKPGQHWETLEDGTLVHVPNGELIPAPSVQVDFDRYLDGPNTRPFWQALRAAGTPPDWPFKPWLSASSLGNFLRCPEQWRRKYVLGEQEPSGGSAVAGTAFHNAVATALRFKAAEGEDLRPDLVGKAFHRSMDRAIDREGGASQIDWGTVGRGQAKRDQTASGMRMMAVKAAVAAADNILPAIQPVEVEQVFRVDIPGIPVPLTGYIDLVTERTIVDWKVGGRRDSSMQTSWRLQGLIYQRARPLDMGWCSLNWSGEYESWIENPRMRMLRNAETHILGGTVPRVVVGAMLAMHAQFGPDQAWPPAYEHQWMCNLCSFKPTCEWWQPKVQAFTL
jgi:hypothetical protein